MDLQVNGQQGVESEEKISLSFKKIIFTPRFNQWDIVISLAKNPGFKLMSSSTYV
jgi:hypothetical protein